MSDAEKSESNDSPGESPIDPVAALSANPSPPISGKKRSRSSGGGGKSKCAKRSSESIEETDEEQESEDEADYLEGFVVPDKEYKRYLRKSKKAKGQPVAETSDSESESDEEEGEEEEEVPSSDGEENVERLLEETQRLTKDLTGTVVGGRVLRDRSKIKPVVDTYWEKYGKKEMARLMEIEDKKAMIAAIQAWIKEGLYKLPEGVSRITMRTSLENIEKYYAEARKAAGLKSEEEELAEDEGDEDESEDEDDFDGDEDEEDDETEEDDEDDEDDEEEDEETDDEDDETEEDE